MSEAAPYLSIVCAFGHAQRDEAWVRQTRIFLMAISAQAERHRLPIEIILVDRNSSGSGQSAAVLLGDPPGNDFTQIRIVTVPGSEIIAGHPIDRERRAQNVGIRRARGDFVLAAGTDIILSDELMRLLASRPLREGVTYHAMRVETVPDFLGGSSVAIGAVESACRRGAGCAAMPPFRAGFDGAAASSSDSSWNEIMRRAAMELKLEAFPLTIGIALGNFLMMGRKSWLEIGGFPEWRVDDPYFDRIVTAQAQYRGWLPTIFPASCHYFSIAPLRAPDPAQDIYRDADGDLRIRIESPPIRHLNNWQSAGLLKSVRRAIPSPPDGPPVEIRVNGPNWGLAEFDLPEERQARGPVTSQTMGYR